MTTLTPRREEVVVQEADVQRALGTVRDPELDESITSLDFVRGVSIRGPEVVVQLRLPTYFCAPNFAYLMVADAYDAVSGLAGVESVRIRLVDHFASDEINAGVAADAGFAGSFPGLADGELAELRRTFQCKAHRAGQERVAAGLVKRGWSLTDLVGATLSDVPAGRDLERLVRRRADLGLPHDSHAALLVHDDGTPIAAEDLPLQLRFAKTTRISIEGNGALCRGLLGVRYGVSARPEEADQV